MKDVNLAAHAELDEVAAEPRRALSLDEQSFRLFYDRTARPLRLYLRRLTRHEHRADDLLQEAYLRLLRAKIPDPIEDAHLRNYLFKIATNLAHDLFRQNKFAELEEAPAVQEHGTAVNLHRDVHRMLGCMKPRERELLWLAYVERFSHTEIAAMIGARAQSIRPMLARARERFAALLKGHQYENE